MRGRLSAAVLSISLLLACRGTPAPTVPSRPSSARAVDTAASEASAASALPVERLRHRIAEILAEQSIAAGTWSVEARSLATHELLVDANAHRLLTPASTMKTLTLAVTADQLGWDYSYETRVIPTGSVVNGVLEGDLVIFGSGDPSFDDWDGAASTVFQSWATRLKELGISTIGGRIVGNDDVFADEGLGAGWMWDDMAFAYSAPASGLQFNEGAAQVVVTPGISTGEPAVLALVPSYARVPLVNAVRTVKAGDSTSILVEAIPRTPGAVLVGSIAMDAARQIRNVSVGNPTLYFANAVRTGLIANGVEVLGGAVDSDDLVEAPAVDQAVAPLTHRSPLLSSLADTLMKLSQNMYAETFLRTLGRERGEAGTAAAGIEVVRKVLASWGVPDGEVLMADGSGLSRYNLVTANAMVSVLTHVYDDVRLREPYVASLPVAGRAGTLSARMKGTAAEGTVQAKTGSFSNARSVAGFARSADGEPIAFAVIANNYGVPAAEVDRVTDAIIVSVAEFKR